MLENQEAPGLPAASLTPPQVHVKLRQQVPGAEDAPTAPRASLRGPPTLARLYLPKESQYPSTLPVEDRHTPGVPGLDTWFFYGCVPQCYSKRRRPAARYACNGAQRKARGRGGSAA